MRRDKYVEVKDLLQWVFLMYQETCGHSNFFFTTSWKIVSLIIAQQILKITCHYFVHVLLLIIRLP